ncbi:unnamed protein product [Closterium sp. NIES-64]|nr:unnamed protein product [Closterium sp. NIES-64]
MNVAEFAHACDGISRLFSLLGVAFAFAGKDFTDKVKDLTAAGKEFSTLGGMVDADVSKGSVKVQNSHTRNLLRVLRGLDMMRRLFCYILEDCMKPLREHASRAYSEVFSAHHSWAIRSLVAAGMYALPSTDSFLHHLGEDEESWREPSSEFVTSVTDVAAAVEDLFVSRDLGLDCPEPASAVSPSFPLHSPLTLRHLHIGPSALDAITDDLLHFIATGCARSLTHLSLYRHMNLRSWERNRGSIDPDDAVAKVTEPAVTALFAACRRLVSLKLTLPLCLPELPASVSLLQRLTRLEVSCGRLDPHIRAVAGGDAATALEPTPQPRFPEGVGSLSALRSLSIRAPCVRALPHTLSCLRSLTSLKLVGCSSLRQLPDGLGQLKKLQYLELAGSSSMDSLPDSIGLLSSLETLHLVALNADFLPDSFAHLSSLKRLFITNLSLLQSLPNGIGELPSLQVLNISSCSLLAALPPSISALSSLTALTVYNCSALTSLPEDIGDPSSPHPLPSLRRLLILKNPSLASLPSGLHLLPSLLHLEIPLSHLQRLHLSHMHISNLPEDLGQMQGLRILTINTAKKLLALPASLTLLTSLQHLRVSECEQVSSLPEEGFGNLSSLVSLTVNDLPLLLKLPAAVAQLPLLQVLDVQECEHLSELPEGLESARSLPEVHVDGCNELEDLPEPIMARTGRIQLHAI